MNTVMHNNLPNFFYFIKEFNEEHIRKLDKKVSIIYRNYSLKYNKKFIQKVKDFCKKDKRKFYISNDINLAINLDLDGVYIPSFNKKLNIKILNNKKHFLMIGSAHSINEIKIKEKQGVELIFLSPLFKTTKSNHFLNPSKFNLLASKTNKKVIALGGINKHNLNKLKMINSTGFASISYFENNGKITK